MIEDPTLIERAAKIKLLLMDCDGVLTDGSLLFSAKGEAIKVFNVRDGQGIAAWHKAGFKSGMITGRDSNGIVETRAAELGMHFVRSKCLNKIAEFSAILAEAGVSADEAAYIGDDVPDIEVLRSAGLSFCPSDAHPSVLEVVDRVTVASGGKGAVREVVDFLLA